MKRVEKMTQTAERRTESRGSDVLSPSRTPPSASNASPIAFSPAQQNVDIVFINELPKVNETQFADKTNFQTHALIFNYNLQQ